MFHFMQRRSPAVFVAILLIVFLYQFPFFWDQFRSRTSPSQAASIFAVSPKRYTRTLVVASTRSEDVSWVAKEFPDLTHAIYVADDSTAPLHPPENKGRESTIYLTYIIDHYHNLSEITIFTHAQQEAWHNNDLFDLDLVRTVRSLSDEHVAKSGFFNLRCHAESGCPDHIHPRKEASTRGQDEETYFRQVWHELHDPDVPLPEVLSAPCCSQFAASRERILSISLQRWEKYRQWLLDTSLPDEISGRIWEFTWHLILTGQAVLCHPIEQCYCEGYGLCFESAADIHAWLAMKEVLLLAKDRQEDLFRKGLNTESIGYRIAQKIERPMRKWWHEAELRGRDRDGGRAGITKLAGQLFNPKAEYRPKIVDVQKRVRGILAGKVVFDTTEAKLVWEHKWFPQYWIPKSAFLPTATFTEDKPISGIQTSTSKLTVSTTAGERSISTLLVPDSFNTPLAGLVKISFDALDQWYEEQAQVVYHPKDPYHRVDCLPSGRRVKVEIDGVVLADTGNEGGVMSLWETGFPGRWYLPRTAVNWEYLTLSTTHTGCPYKGEASYYNAVIDGKEYKDVVWWYKSPILESGLIIGMLCFYPDKVDAWIDGEKAEKTGMPFAKGNGEDKPMEKKEEVNGHERSCNC